jgi:hypothetical protein
MFSRPQGREVNSRKKEEVVEGYHLNAAAG